MISLFLLSFWLPIATKNCSELEDAPECIIWAKTNSAWCGRKKDAPCFSSVCSSSVRYCDTYYIELLDDGSTGKWKVITSTQARQEDFDAAIKAEGVSK